VENRGVHVPDPATVNALDDLALGRGVRRGRHELPAELFPVFEERLRGLGFRAVTVAQVEIEIGTRVPAWRLAPPVADFGTVFWEVFTPRAKRKLFGSEARNRKGDWDVQLYPTSPETIFANLDLAERYDASRPIGVY
jgi:hypothetical protein